MEVSGALSLTTCQDIKDLVSILVSGSSFLNIPPQDQDQSTLFGILLIDQFWKARDKAVFKGFTVDPTVELNVIRKRLQEFEAVNCKSNLLQIINQGLL